MPKIKETGAGVAGMAALEEMLAGAKPISEVRSARPAKTKEERSALMKDRLDKIYEGHEWQVVGTGYNPVPKAGSSGYKLKRYFVVQAADDPSVKRVAGRRELLEHAQLLDSVPVIRGGDEG